MRRLNGESLFVSLQLLNPWQVSKQLCLQSVDQSDNRTSQLTCPKQQTENHARAESQTVGKSVACVNIGTPCLTSPKTRNVQRIPCQLNRASTYAICSNRWLGQSSSGVAGAHTHTQGDSLPQRTNKIFAPELCRSKPNVSCSCVPRGKGWLASCLPRAQECAFAENNMSKDALAYCLITTGSTWASKRRIDIDREGVAHDALICGTKNDETNNWLQHFKLNQETAPLKSTLALGKKH